MDPLFYLPAATLIIGAGMGLIVGRATSGAKYWRRKCETAADHAVVASALIRKHRRRADALEAKENRRMAPLRAANAKRKADAQAREAAK
jgi:hypothetical protein